MEEINVPDPKYYIPVGYDKDTECGTMHYRYVVRSELEESEYIDQSPFMKYEILKGQERGLDESIFNKADSHDAAGQGSNVTTTGIFKAICRITRADEQEANRQKVAALKQQREEALESGNIMAAAIAQQKVNWALDDDVDEDFEIMRK